MNPKKSERRKKTIPIRFTKVNVISLFAISTAAINIRHKLATVLVVLRCRRRKRQKPKAKTRRKFRIFSLNVEHSLLGAYNTTFLLPRENDRFIFFKYTCMSPERFDHLLSLIRPKTEKEYKVRPPISAEERLSATLRYLATGDSKQSISYQYKMGKSTIN